MKLKARIRKPPSAPTQPAPQPASRSEPKSAEFRIGRKTFATAREWAWHIWNEIPPEPIADRIAIFRSMSDNQFALYMKYADVFIDEWWRRTAIRPNVKEPVTHAEKPVSARPTPPPAPSPGRPGTVTVVRRKAHLGRRTKKGKKV